MPGPFIFIATNKLKQASKEVRKGTLAGILQCWAKRRATARASIGIP